MKKNVGMKKGPPVRKGVMKALNSKIFALVPEKKGEPSDHEPFNSGLRIVTQKFADNLQVFSASFLNYFGGIQFKKVKIDSGADGVLLYFTDVGMIKVVYDKFTREHVGELRFTIETGAGIANTFRYLNIHSEGQPFLIHFCRDLLPNSTPFEVFDLKFVLCQADVQAIHDDEALEPLKSALEDASSLDSLNEVYVENNEEAILSTFRRGHVLVGQSIFDVYSWHEHRGVGVIYDRYEFNFRLNYDGLCSRIFEQLSQMKSNIREQAEFCAGLELEPNEEASSELTLGGVPPKFSSDPDWVECVVNCDDYDDLV